MAERWRDLAGAVGVLEPGPRNAITDVPGVRVGHAQARSGQRTGVTVVAPPALPAPAGTATVNGVGELVAALEVAERGRMETPVHLCGTHAVGTVAQAAVAASGRGPDDVVIPVVGECDDGDMADSRTVVAEDLRAALDALGTEVAEGSVGVLLLCNFGDREYLDLLGARLAPAARRRRSHGSCIAVCATNAPLSALQLRRLALRPLLGLSRAGSYASEGSGEIGLAFATAHGELEDGELSALFAASWEAAHEAVYNCLVAARPATRRDGSEQDAFPVEAVRALASARRVAGDQRLDAGARAPARSASTSPGGSGRASR